MMLEKVKEYAIRKHKESNHKYDEYDYSFHLQKVFNVSDQFIHLIEKQERENVQCACWVHDIIEDARETYNDVKKETNETIADLAYALTNEKGRTRSERANDKYYLGIRETKNASFVKFCDRIANVEYSKSKKSGMFDKYKQENENFVAKIYAPEFEEIANYLNQIFNS